MSVAPVLESTGHSASDDVRETSAQAEFLVARLRALVDLIGVAAHADIQRGHHPDSRV